ANQEGCSSTYTRRAIQHEFFHMLDLADDGELYEDKVWKNLNLKGFHYGSGGSALQNNPYAGLLEPAGSGFLNAYSRSGVEEDKAEVFSCMMVHAGWVELMARQDPILKIKTNRMK